MVQASQTTVSAAGLWTIVVVMTILLAFWLSAIALADRSQARASGRARLAGDTGPALRGARAGGSVAGAQAPEISDEPAHEPVMAGAADTPGTGARGGHATGDAVPRGEPRADMPTRGGMPAQQTAGRHERPAMPRQRSGEADRAERSYAGQATPDDGERDR